MNLAPTLDLFGWSLHSTPVQRVLSECGAAVPAGQKLERYSPVKSDTLGIEFWFWWKEYWREQIAPPQGETLPPGGEELVLYELRLTPEGLAGAALPFGLTFPASPESVEQAFGTNPFSKSKNVLGEPIWTFYVAGKEVLVIFEKNGAQVRCFKIIALKRLEQQKLDFLASLPQQKPNLRPEQVPQIEALASASPARAWEQRRLAGDRQFSAAAIADAEPLFAEFLASVAQATQARNPKGLYNAVIKTTKAINKFAKQHRRCIETLEREEIVAFLIQALTLSGLRFDPQFDLTAEHRAW